MRRRTAESRLVICGMWLVTVGLASACSLKKMTVDQTAVVMQDASAAYEYENDLELAAAAIPGTLKTVEGFLQASPEQRILLRILAENYMSYAFGFLEDEAEALQDDNPERAEVLRNRALNLHLRARGFGLRLLALDNPELAATLTAGEMPSDEALARVRPEEIEGLFWTANAWAAAINVGKSDPQLVAQLSIPKALMQRCATFDESYFWAGPHMALGAMEAALPRALGGQPEVASRHFERAIALTGGKHLMTKVLYARAVGIQSGDRALFEKTLQEVLAADPDAEPRLGLANRLAQRRARRYLDTIDDLFI